MPKEALGEWRFHNVRLFATRAADVTAALIAAARRGMTLYEPQAGAAGRKSATCASTT